MYTALHDNKIIPDPLFRDNDVKLRWIALEDWTYTRAFEISSEVLTSGSIRLVCDGLDTISTVYINDQKVGISENMFVQYIYDIKKVAKENSNTIRIDFKSAVVAAKERANASSYLIPNNCPVTSRGECHVNFIRKAQLSFGWDFGPCFPTQGIWRNIYIQAYNTAVIRELAIIPPVRESTGEWTVNISVYFDVSGGSVTGRLDTNIAATSFMMSQTLTLNPRNSSVSYSIRVPSSYSIDRWWPNGYGSQPLYTINITFTSNSEVSSKQRRVGFRTVELVQDPVGNNQGLTFYFRINGLPVFLKGSNWIPADSFLETVTRERLRRLFQSAAEVHMNAIRINGIGIYESDDFYDLADEFGILIWHDLMFSDVPYPATPGFLDTVSHEITHQIRRLKHHPCIIQWSGNNESEEGVRFNWYRLKNLERYIKDYVTLYVTTIKAIVDHEDPSRGYVTSCPSDGKESQREGWVAKNPQDEHFGDVHYYNYTADLWSVEPFPIPRLASEYGTEAWCDIETLEDVFYPSDFDYSGKMMLYRNHHPDGNQQMVNEMKYHFQLPNNPDTKQRFKDMIYMTQINQAVSVQTATEHFRRWQNDLTSDGRGQTMGALYWQLADIWQAPTWAGIDYKGKWKMLHYYARKFFAPVLISPFMDGNVLNIYMVVDEIPLTEVKDTKTGMNVFTPATTSLLQSSFPNHEAVHLMKKTTEATSGTLYIQMYRWDSFTPLKTWNVTLKLTQSSQSVFRQDVYSMMAESNCPDDQSCFVYIYLNNPSSDINKFFMLTPICNYFDAKGLAKAQLKIAGVTRLSETEFQLTLVADHIAPYVWLDAYRVPGRFSDNGFIMINSSRAVTFTSWDPVDLDLFTKSLSVKSLMDVYV
ncbi:beta-mannosidase-like isoform X2 [Haliotis rufescens]|uniref:beta-mannosidase-like isoform X2 n=1 Tax=Haliotis rufescens TaxID=6454 RepID=UPI00201F0CAA|nr:beta-mannosidase-like isoform X2 [Haliotis rufescens]